MSGTANSSRPRRASRPRPWWVLLLLVLVLLLVLAWWWSSRGGSDSAVSPTNPSATSAGASPTGAEEPSASAPSGSGEPSPTPRKTKSPAPITASADPVAGVTARLTKVEAVEGEAKLPGEISGPAVRITVAVKNSLKERLPLGSAVVNLYYGEDRTPGIPMTRPGGRAFPTSVDPGGTGKGVFLFGVPEGEQDLIRVELDLSDRGDVVIFEGKAG